MSLQFSKFIVLISIIFLASSSSAKKLSIAEPILSKNLTEMHYTLNKYPNKLGYSNNEYIILYGNTKIWAHDMNGKELEEWNTKIKRALLLKNCNLLVIDDNQNEFITEKNTNGEILWSYKAPGITHHDIEVDEKGIITFLYRKDLPEDFPLKNLCSHDEVITDRILQVNRQGEKVFEWEFHKHYQDALNADKCTPARRKWLANSGYSKKLDWVHPNAINVIKENKWYKKGYEEFKPGNIMVTAHHFHEAIIIDKDTKKVVWSYKGDELPLEFPHEAKMIDKGLPGAGNILIFDNGNSGRNYSRILEINPITKKTVWSYSKPGEFFNRWAGTQKRLKNGDTFISDSNSGRAFIVNRKGETLWQFTRQGSSWVKRVQIYPKKDFVHCF